MDDLALLVDQELLEVPLSQREGMSTPSFCLGEREGRECGVQVGTQARIKPWGADKLAGVSPIPFARLRERQKRDRTRKNAP